MAVTFSSAVLFGASLVFAACAIFWPQIEQIYLQQAGNLSSKLTGKCPLGYEGPMPANHPPVMPPANKQSTADEGEKPKQPRSGVPGGVSAAELAGPFLHYINGNIWTANTESPWATSMMVDTATGRIVSMDTQSSSGSAGKVTEIDMQGAFVMPGFVDPHVHLIPSGLALADVNLRHVGSKQELVQRIADRAAAAAAAAAYDGEGGVPWLLGGGWSEHEWGGDLPDASWIDAVTGDIPAVFLRMDYHMAWVNSAALAAAGLLEPEAHLDEPGVDRDEEGRPTGLLREAAMDIVRKRVPAASVEARRAALATAGSYLLSRGVTSVGDMGWGLFGLPEDTWNDLELVYDWAAGQDELPLRVAPYVPLHSWQRLSKRVAARGDHHHSERLFWGGVKEFADGSLGSSSALFWDPYNDSPSGNAGMRPIPQAELEQLVVGAAGAGLQVAVHAIGDRALDEVLQVFEQVDPCESGSAARPCWQHRLEHVQHITGAASAAKMAQLKLLAVPNPQHLISDMEIMLAKLGPERAGAGRSHAYRTMAEMGVSVAFGSDWPVADIHPFESVYIAVHRSELPQQAEQSGSSSDAESQLPAVPSATPAVSWAPEERMPLDAVLLSHTVVPAKAIRLDHMVGTLQAGFKADFIVLDRSPFTGFKDGAAMAAGDGGFAAGVPKVVRTYLDGQCVYGCEGDLAAAAAVPDLAVATV